MTEFSGPADMFASTQGKPVMIYGWDGVNSNFRPVTCNPSGQIVAVEQAPLFRNITSAATTVVKSGAGTLFGLVFNKIVTLSTVTIYDNTAASGTKIATITNPAALLASQIHIPLWCAFSTGLTIVSSSTDDFTVLYT